MNSKWIIILLLIVSTSLQAQVEKSLPVQDNFILGGGILTGVSEGKGDYMDVADKPLCYFIEGSYKHYISPFVGLGATYEYITSSNRGNEMKSHFASPTLTLRYPMDENTHAMWTSLGMGCLFYSDKLRGTNFYGSSTTFSKPYFCVSWALGYDFAIAKAVGMQVKAEFLFADWYFNPDYTPKFARDDEDDYQSVFKSKFAYISLGLTLLFGK